MKIFNRDKANILPEVSDTQKALLRSGIEQIWDAVEHTGNLQRYLDGEHTIGVRNLVRGHRIRSGPPLYDLLDAGHVFGYKREGTYDLVNPNVVASRLDVDDATRVNAAAVAVGEILTGRAFKFADVQRSLSDVAGVIGIEIDEARPDLPDRDQVVATDRALNDGPLSLSM